MLKDFRWYRALRGGIWTKICLRNDPGQTEFWLSRNEKPRGLGIEKVIAREFYSPFDPDLFHDGFHTNAELYDHRHALFMLVLSLYGGWKSQQHEDGSRYPGWFIAGTDLPSGPISYHLPMKHWDLCPAVEQEQAPAWDGHTSEDVLNRLNSALVNPHARHLEAWSRRLRQYPQQAWMWHQAVSQAMQEAGVLDKRAAIYAAHFMITQFDINIRDLCPKQWDGLGVD